MTQTPKQVHVPGHVSLSLRPHVSPLGVLDSLHMDTGEEPAVTSAEHEGNFYDVHLGSCQERLSPAPSPESSENMTPP